MKEKPTVYYFGCIGTPGHYLFHPETGEVRIRNVGQPWGNRIDGAVFPDGHPSGKAGLVRRVQLNGWTAVGWADYSVDSRQGSHSTFLVQADMTAQEVIALAREQWTKVFGRPKYPDLTLPEGDG